MTTPSNYSLPLACGLQEPPSVTPEPDLAITMTDTAMMPQVSIDDPDPSERPLTRRGVLKLKKFYTGHRDDTYQQMRSLPSSQEKNALSKIISDCADEERELERCLVEQFVPQHNDQQFLSPRAFFISPLFRVCSKALPRNKQLELCLPTMGGRAPVRYSGPELRQTDGRVFLALLHMLRDVQLGIKVNFQPESVCRALFHRYDGPSRALLRTHIQRLQKGLIISDHFSVQLCLSFEYPRLGGWTVALDPHIVELFKFSPEVWFPLQYRLELNDGLATWLYTYIESQTKLIPMRIARLRELCGSNAGDRAFTNSLRLALHHVAATGLIDTAWTLRGGQVRWLKKSRSST